MIQINKLSFSYGNNLVLEDVTAHFEKGKTYCIVGENGAGKTTLIESMLGIKKNIKNITFNNKPFGQEKQKVGVVFQENGLFPRIKVIEELDAYAEIYHTDKAWKDEVINIFRLEPLLKKYGMSLSGGERRRVLLALAFIGKPKYIILDEPFTGIDTQLRDTFRDFMEAYVSQNGAVMIFSEHNLFECNKHNYYFMFLYKRKIALQGYSEDIYAELNIDKSLDIQDIYMKLWGGNFDEKIIQK